MEPGSIQHSGYLTPGDEINVQGGFTVHFQKKQRRYWTLQYFGEGNLVLNGFKDEKSFRRSTSSPTPSKTSTLGRQRKLSSAPVETVRLMTSLKVHKFEMKTKRKVENALIVVSGSHPKFFRPDNKEELEKWHSAFMKFASAPRSVKRRVKPRQSPEHLAPSTASTAFSSQNSPNLERDSGISTSFTKSVRESDRSSSSSMSSDEMNEYSPGRIFPSTVFFDAEDDGHNTSPAPSPTLREHSGRQTSKGSRASIFVRNSEGIYEERIADLDSGIYDTTLPRISPDDRPDSVYDVLPQSSPSPRSVDNKEPVLAGKPSRRSKFSSPSSSFDNTDSSIPEEEEKDPGCDVTERLAKTLGLKNSSELQQILDDDGRTHTYINQKLPSKSKEKAGPPLPERPPSLQSPRKSSLGSRLSDSDYHQEVLRSTRKRAESMPIGIDLDYSPSTGQPPIPEDVQPLPGVEALMAEHARDEVEVQIAKEDLVGSIALVDIKGKVIIAGWSKDLFGKLHVGDHLIQVNDQVVSQAEWANTFIKTSSRSTIALHINRLPYAKIVNCTRIHEDTFWGIECNRNEITHVGSGPAKEAGLTEKSESSAYSKKSCEWIITEAANKPITIKTTSCPKDEMRQYLATRDLDLPLVVHPKDFINDLNRALGKLKRSSFYRVG